MRPDQVIVEHSEKTCDCGTLGHRSYTNSISNVYNIIENSIEFF